MKHLFMLLFFITISVNAQVGIGTTTPDPSSILDIVDTNKGILVPRMTMAERNAIITPATGLLIYQTDNTAGFYYFNGTNWSGFGEGLTWGLTGNAGTSPSTSLLGTNDAQDFIISTNDNEVIRVGSNQNVGFNTAPTSKLHIKSKILSSIPLDADFETNVITPIFTTGGDANWITTNAAGEFYSGSIGAKSGDIDDNETTWLEFTTTIPSYGGTISFAVRSSCQDKWDNLEFSIDGTVYGTWNDDEPWEKVSYSLAQGTHTFRWAYIKGGFTSSFNDEVYLDDIKIVAYGAPTLQVLDGNNTAGKMLTSDADGVATWKDPEIDTDWAFFTGNSNLDPIYHQGNVRIGSANPTTYNLHIQKGTSSSGTKFGIGSVEYITDGFNQLRITEAFTPINNNSINLGLSGRRWTAVYALNGVINTSDRRLKTDIKPLTYGLNDVLQLRPVSFQWKEEKVDDFIIPEHETKLGLIAQEVLKIIPESIETHEWLEYEENPGVLIKEEMRRMGISYSEIIPVVIKAIQDQELIIKDLEAHTAYLESVIKKLKE